MTDAREPHVPLADVEALFDALIREVTAARHDTRAQLRRDVLEQLHGARAGIREAALGALVDDALSSGGTPPPVTDSHPEETR